MHTHTADYILMMLLYSIGGPKTVSPFDYIASFVANSENSVHC